MLRLTRPAAVGLVGLFVIVLGATSVASAADAKGKIKSVTADRSEVAMIDNAGKSWTITAAKDCKVRLNDKDSKLADLKAGDAIMITYAKSGEKLVAQTILATRK